MDQQNVLGCVGIVGLILLVIVAIVGGTHRTEITFVPSDVAAAGPQTEFKESLNSNHWVFGLVKGRQPDLQAALGKYLRAGDQVTKLTIVTRHTWLNFLLTGVTMGIYCPQSIVVKGTIARK
jgi:hypothetical protein